MKEEKVIDIYSFKTLSEAIDRIEMPKWKKYLLRKLMPAEFMSAAPQTITDAIPKGAEEFQKEMTRKLIIEENKELKRRLKVAMEALLEIQDLYGDEIAQQALEGMEQ